MIHSNQAEKKEKGKERDISRSKDNWRDQVFTRGDHSSKNKRRRITFYWLSVNRPCSTMGIRLDGRAHLPGFVTTRLIHQNRAERATQEPSIYHRAFFEETMTKKKQRTEPLRTRRPPRQDWGLLPGRGSCHGNPTTPESFIPRSGPLALFHGLPQSSISSHAISFHPLEPSLHTRSLSSSFHLWFTPISSSFHSCHFTPTCSLPFSVPLRHPPSTMFLWSRTELASRKLRPLPEEKSQKLVASRRISASRMMLCRSDSLLFFLSITWTCALSPVQAHRYRAILLIHRILLVFLSLLLVRSVGERFRDVSGGIVGFSLYAVDQRR